MIASAVVDEVCIKRNEEIFIKTSFVCSLEYRNVQKGVFWRKKDAIIP